MEDKDGIAVAIGSAIAGAAVVAGFFVNQAVAGAIIGVVAGFFLSYFTATRTQRRAWKRDFITKAVDVVYGPLYNETSMIERRYHDALKSRSFAAYPVDAWLKIRDNYTYHMVDEGLKKDLEEYYYHIMEYNEIVSSAWQIVQQIVRDRGSEAFDMRVERIVYFVKATVRDANFGVRVEDTMLPGIHPLQFYSEKLEPTYLEIEYRESSSVSKTTKLNSPEDYERFERFWSMAMNDIENNSSLQKMKRSFHEIPAKNKIVAEKLITKIQAPWKV